MSDADIEASKAPLMDHLMGTREHYIGSERYERDEERRRKRKVA